MFATALSASIVGVDGVPVRVEVDVAFGLPGLTIVGLAGSAVLEARERVRAALRNSGFVVPARRITINLAPAWLTRPADFDSCLKDRVSPIRASEPVAFRGPAALVATWWKEVAPWASGLASRRLSRYPSRNEEPGLSRPNCPAEAAAGAGLAAIRLEPTNAREIVPPMAVAAPAIPPDATASITSSVVTHPSFIATYAPGSAGPPGGVTMVGRSAGISARRCSGHTFRCTDP